MLLKVFYEWGWAVLPVGVPRGMMTMDGAVRIAALLLKVFLRVGLRGPIPSVSRTVLLSQDVSVHMAAVLLDVVPRVGLGGLSRRLHASYDDSGRLGTNGGCASRSCSTSGAGRFHPVGFTHGSMTLVVSVRMAVVLARASAPGY